VSDFFPALDQQKGEQLTDYVARLEKAHAVAPDHEPDKRRHRAIAGHLTTAMERLQGHSLERVQRAITALSAEDRHQLLQWLAANPPTAAD
jgi:hypothetical protein